MIGLRIVVISCQLSRNLFWYTSETETVHGPLRGQRALILRGQDLYSQDLSFISLISAPAEAPRHPTRVSVAAEETWGGTRTSKGLLRACDDNGADLLVCVNEAQRLVQFREQLGVECVERLWAVEGHECDAWLRP